MEFILEHYILIWVCIFGLCFGSFFNVVILRSLTGESIVFPASKCPHCSKTLKPWHNIPVLSYICLRGKCAFCKEKISIQYPLIELFTMILFASTYLKFGLTVQTGFLLIILSGFLIMSMTDLKEKLVDCNIAIFLAILGIIYNWLANNTLLDSLYGLIVGVIIMESLSAIGYLLKKGRAFGEADTYVAGAIGALFGLSNLLQILFYTIFASMIFILPAFLYKQFKNNQKTTCILFILFITIALVYKSLSQTLITGLILIILGIFLAINILKNLHQDEKPLYLPLVPAFSIAVLYFLFI